MAPSCHRQQGVRHSLTYGTTGLRDYGTAEPDASEFRLMVVLSSSVHNVGSIGPKKLIRRLTDNTDCPLLSDSLVADPGDVLVAQ